MFFSPRQLLSIFTNVQVVVHAASNSSFLRPEILADTNRDGLVNGLDTVGKHVWTQQRGAIFLPNIGDSHHRCPDKDLTGRPLSNEELASCHDASGNLLLTPEYAASISTTPLKGLSSSAQGRIYTMPHPSMGRARIFWQHGQGNDASQWTLIDPQFSFNATSLAQGLTLAIDGRELVTDSDVWDGAVNVFFEVTDGDRVGTDVVSMRQAPVLVHHHLQRPNVLLSTAGNETFSPWQAKFVSSVTAVVGELKDEVMVQLFNQSDDIWAQDFLEPAYASMPGLNGPVSIRVLLRSAQSTRVAGRQVFQQLRDRGIGGFQPGLGSGFGFEEINSGGNIETIPPYTSKSGVSYASGRVIMGKHHEKQPANSMVRFLKAQGAQSPLFLETGWLAIGHVDEVVQFLPFDNELGFTIAIADTVAAFDVLQKAQKDGYGSAMVSSYGGDMTPDRDTIFLDPSVKNKTISHLLSNKHFLGANEYAQRYINYNLDLLLQEIPLRREDVIRIPVFWKDVTYPWPLGDDGLPPRLQRAMPGEMQLKSFYPEAINGVVLGHDYLAPKPWGPIVQGKDIFQEAVVAVYARANMTVHFIDDFMSHHVRGGEVHCGTNTLRETNVTWWK